MNRPFQPTHEQLVDAGLTPVPFIDPERDIAAATSYARACYRHAQQYRFWNDMAKHDRLIRKAWRYRGMARQWAQTLEDME